MVYNAFNLLDAYTLYIATIAFPPRDASSLNTPKNPNFSTTFPGSRIFPPFLFPFLPLAMHLIHSTRQQPPVPCSCELAQSLPAAAVLRFPRQLPFTDLQLTRKYDL